MKRNSVIVIRIALMWFLLGSTSGTLMLLNRSDVIGSSIWILRSSHIDTMLLGFTIQFAFGVALWILPRARHAANRRPQNDLWAALLFNAGLICRTVASMTTEATIQTWFSGLGIWFLATGIVLFVWKLWPRIQSIEKLTAH